MGAVIKVLGGTSLHVKGQACSGQVSRARECLDGDTECREQTGSSISWTQPEEFQGRSQDGFSSSCTWAERRLAQFTHNFFSFIPPTAWQFAKLGAVLGCRALLQYNWHCIPELTSGSACQKTGFTSHAGYEWPCWPALPGWVLPLDPAQGNAAWEGGSSPSTRHAAVALQEGWQGSLFLNVTVLGQHEADNMLLFRMSLCTHHQAVPMSWLGTAFLEQPGTAACPLHAVLTDLR